MDVYKKAFEPLSVPEDMLERIMARSEAPAQPIPFPRKRRTASILALAACLTLVVCGSLAFQPWAPQPQPTEQVKLVNPIQTAEGVTALAETLPFPLAVPTQLPEGYAFEHASSILGTLAQVIYLNGEEKLTYRMSEGAGDISGDFNQYPETATVDGVTLKGDGGLVSLALWEDGGYTYSLSSTAPLPAETVLAVQSHVEPA